MEPENEAAVDLLVAQLLYPEMFGVPVCMPDNNGPLYNPLCGRGAPSSLKGRDWAKVTCPDCLNLRRDK